MQDRRPESGFALIGALLRDSSALVGDTLALARAEIAGTCDTLLRLLALLGTVLVLVVSAFFVFLDALVKLFAVLIGSEAAAAGLVASPFVLAAGILAALGIRRISAAAGGRPASTEVTGKPAT